MDKFVQELHRVLNRVKDFCAGYAVDINDKMVISYRDKLYVISISEVDGSYDTDEEIISKMSEELTKIIDKNSSKHKGEA